MTVLLPKGFSKRLETLSIVTKSRKLGHHKGVHRSIKIGSSLDFSDYRTYHPGDDIRHIDWNVYARTDKPFIKQYLDEQEMRIHILVDSTKSMHFEEKRSFSLQLAVCLSQIALKSGDTVSFSTHTDERTYFIRGKGAQQRAVMSTYISQVETATDSGLFTEQALGQIPKALTILFVITDGLEPLTHWQVFFRRLRRICQDVRVVTVHSQSEEEPTMQGNLRLVDSETSKTVEVTMTNETEKDYYNKKKAHEIAFAKLAATYGIGVLQVQVEDGIVETMTKKMRQVDWIR